MDDFIVDIKLEITETDNETLIKTFKAEVLSDETVNMIMEDVAKRLEEATNDNN
mgnify:CR=1 FL=1